MRILLVSPFSIVGVGGSSRLLRDIAAYLVQRGHQVDVLCYSFGHERDLVEFGRAHGYTVYPVMSRRLRGASSLFMLTRIVILCLARRYNLVLCGVAFPSAVLAYVARFVTCRPYAIYSHGEDVTMVQGSRLKTALLARALRGARRVMANSTFSQREIAALGVDPERITRVPPWIDPTPYEQVPPSAVEALRAKLGLDEKHVILTVARLTARKGHDAVIRTLPSLKESIPDVQYLIVGHGDQHDLRALAESEGVADRVTIVDHVADADLPALYHLCDVYVMVSRWDPVAKQVDGFGIVYLEAAAAGKPSVAGSAGGCPDAVEDGVTGLIVDPMSANDTARALSVLLGDSARAAAMGAAGRQRVRDHFHKQLLLDRVSNILIEPPAADTAQKNGDDPTPIRSGPGANILGEE